ncbi:MAG TPA: GNAT family N-acetyltransferase, partial [Actinomycetota bacterium]
MGYGRPGVPPGYAARPAERGDLIAVGELLQAAEAADYGDSTLGADFVARKWGRPGFDPPTHAWVITDADVLIAYGEAFREPGSTEVDTVGLVHPRHRGRGLRPLLVAWAERRAADLWGRGNARTVVVQTATATPDVEARELLMSRGYRMVRSFFHMVIDLPPPTSTEPSPPTGVIFRSFVPGQDDAAAHQTIGAAFRGSWGFRPQSFEEFRDGLVNRDVVPELSLMADQGGGLPVGVLLGAAMNDMGWVDILAVLPSHRGRGIGSALLRAGFAR